MAMDIVIKGGTVVDGTGKPGFLADVGIVGDRISAIERNLPLENASLVIDATGKVVAPGFIDVHCHTDWSILEGQWDDHQERQGITTQIAGLCGTAPVSPAAHFSQAESRGLGTNYALFAGHGSIRKEVMGEEKRPPNPEEISIMKDLTRKAMDEGALGLSTGLIYAPGRFADTNELVQLAKVAAQYGGIYATHMRSESDEISQALREALEVARASQAQLQISHIKVILPRNWGKAQNIIETVIKEKEAGLNVAADQYPYTITGGGLYGASKLVEGWDKETGPGRFLERYGDVSERKRMSYYVDSLLRERGGAQYFTIIRVAEPGYLGKSLLDAAQLRGISPGEFCIEALYESKGEFALAYESVSEEELISFMTEPWVMVGTDGVLGAFHPRTHGTFPRVLGRYVREKGVLTLEEAIRKMTSLPADTFGFKGRGRLQAGAYADIVVFDPGTVSDRATLLEPTAYPAGIEHVLVNGVPVILSSERTDAFPGRVLVRSSS